MAFKSIRITKNQIMGWIHQEPICYLLKYLLTYLFIKFISITNLTKSV